MPTCACAVKLCSAVSAGRESTTLQEQYRTTAGGGGCCCTGAVSWVSWTGVRYVLYMENTRWTTISCASDAAGRVSSAGVGR